MSATSSARLERLDRDALVGLVVALGAVRDVQAGQPVGVEDVRVAAAAGGHVLGLDAERLERGRRRRDRRRACAGSGSRGTAPRRGSRRRTRRRSRRPCSASTIRSTVRVALSWSRLRASSSSLQRSATTFAAVPPSIRPTFAVVSSSRRPSSIRAERVRRRDDRAAAVLRPDAGVRRLPVEVRLDPVVGGRRHDQLADRRRVVEHEAEVGPQAAAVERLGARRAPPPRRS